MTLLEIFLIGIGLSMDAFAVAICKGLAMPDKVHKRSAFLIALYFGVFQAVMPTLGWLLGSQFAHYVTRFAPWIAFVLLALIGGNMIREALSKEEENAFCIRTMKGFFLYIRGNDSREFNQAWSLLNIEICMKLDLY